LALLHAISGSEQTEMNAVAFDVLLHLGTLAAVFLLYYRDITLLWRGGISLLLRPFQKSRFAAPLSEEEKLVLLLVLATFPMALALVLEDAAEALYEKTYLIGGALVLNGIFLLLSDRFPARVQSTEQIKARHALTIGLGQLAAIVPGLSRSGTTVGCGMLCGLSRETAVKFSFLLSIPTILGANAVKIPALLSSSLSSSDLLACTAGALTALVCGILAMKLLIYLSKKARFTPFGLYCIAVGLAAIVLGG
jgi:undecaprenyl-diphosphatase